MGKTLHINPDLVSQLSLLAAGSTCVAVGGLAGTAVAAFGVFAVPVIGLVSLSLAEWLRQQKQKDPASEKAVRKIQDAIN